jgi:hypothetical protein
MAAPLPMTERPRRIAELEQELNKLGYIEHLLADATDRAAGAQLIYILQAALSTWRRRQHDLTR